MNVNNYLHISLSWQNTLDDFFGILPESVSAGRDDPTLGLGRLIGDAVAFLRGESGGILGFLLGSLCLCFLLSCFENHIRGGEGNLPPVLCVFNFALCLGILPICQGLASSGDELASLFSGIVPVFTSLSLGLGCVGVAAAQSFALTATLALLGGGSEGVLALFCPPLLFAAAVSPLTRECGFDVGVGLKRIFTRGISLLGMLLGGVVGLQTVVASARDSLTLRATRVAVSEALPMVGGAVSGAVSSIAGGLGYACSTVGAFSVVALLSLSLSPLLLALAYRLSLGLCLFMLKTSGASRTHSAVAAVVSAFDAAIGVYALTSAIYILETLAFMKAMPSWL